MDSERFSLDLETLRSIFIEHNEDFFDRIFGDAAIAIIPLVQVLYLDRDYLEVDTYIGYLTDDVSYDEINLHATISEDLQAEIAVSSSKMGFGEMRNSTPGVMPPFAESNLLPVHFISQGEYLSPTTYDVDERRDLEFVSALGAQGLGWLDMIGELL